MSVCGRVALCGPYAPRQWRGGGQRATAGPGFSQGIYKGFTGGFVPESCGRLDQIIRCAGPRECRAADLVAAAQLFSSALIFLSNSSNEVAPLTISPLMKKVGVELTFSTSLANFWSAAIL